MTVLIASTIASYKGDHPIEATAWMAHADLWRERGRQFFCAMQSPDERLLPLKKRLESLGAVIWTFDIHEQFVQSVGNSQRLAGICTGRNLAHEYAQRDTSIEAILFLDTDVLPPEDAVERLMEIDHPVVGGHVPTYCLDGPRLTDQRVPDVRVHWNTAGFLLVRREVFRRIRWRWDIEAGMTDDPCFAADAEAAGFGPEWVRHDTVGLHQPASIGPFDQRGHDLSITRPR